MSSKKGSLNKTSKKYVSKKKSESEEYDSEEMHNSEDEYATQSSSEIDENTQSGGESDESQDSSHQSSEDNSTLDRDPDDEADPNEDDIYDPVEEFQEDEDPDEESDENGEGEEEGDEEEEIGDEGEEFGEDGEEYHGKTCHLKDLNKDYIVLDEDDSTMYGKLEFTKIPENERETGNIMTYYEMVRIIGTRAQQFNLGASPLVEGIDHLHPAKMAYVELIAKMTPYIIRRHLPCKKYEEWKVDELEIIHEITDDFFVPEKFDWNSLMKQSEKISKSVQIIESKRNKDSNSRVTGSKTNKKKVSKKKSNRDTVTKKSNKK